jgi:hypothetical protein
MATWGVFEAQMPEMAAAGRALLYQYGVGLAYLATVRSDGGPRVHPVDPTIVDDGMWVAIGEHSPKCRDLLRDPRFALHTLPGPDVDDEFYVTGTARRADAAGIAACEQGLARDGVNSSDHVVFELDLERALWSKYDARPAWPPAYTRWRADAPG